MEERNWQQLSPEEEESLGLLNMDSVKAFGEEMDLMQHTNSIIENLLSERAKAMKLLTEEEPHRSNIGSLSHSNTSTEKFTVKTPEKTDYVPYRFQNLINISDLVVEKTIDLDSARESNSVSFEPSEMTGRSTQCKADLIRMSKNISVAQILSSSHSEKVRNYGSEIGDPRNMHAYRKEKNRCSESRFTNSNFSSNADLSKEVFTPAEMMLNKLTEDEAQWEQEYATIPKSRTSSTVSINPKENRTTSISSDCDISIGSYFSKRSEKLYNIVSEIKSPTRYNPLPLISDSSLTSPSSIGSNSSSFDCNKSKREPRISTSITKGNTYVKSAATPGKFDATDSIGNPLSVSAIEDVINNFNYDDMLNELKSRKNASKKSPKKISKVFSNQDFNKKPKKGSLAPKFIGSDDKENYEPEKDIQLSETVSFTESLLECSDMKQLEKQEQNIYNKNEYSTLDSRKSIQSKHDNESKHFPYSQTSSHSQHNLFDVDECTSNNAFPTSIDENHSYRKSTGKALHSKESRKRPLSLYGNENMQSRSRTPSPQYSTPENSAPSSPDKTQKLSPSNNETSNVSPREFILKSPLSDSGKLSLPNYGLVSRSASTETLTLKIPSRSVSQCSSSSEFSHNGNKIPLKASCLEISWGSVKLRNCVKKSVIIKNYYSKKLVVRVEVLGPGFQVHNFEDGNILTLQPFECQNLYVSFCPTMIGTAIGCIQFKSPGGGASTYHIRLYGFGGHASLSLLGTTTGPVGSPFITMGELQNLSSHLTKTFVVENRGSLNGFAIVLIDTMSLDFPQIGNCIEVTPAKALVPPKGNVRFHVTFRPRREDVRKIVKKITNVMTIGKLKVICGDEPTRQRIRKAINSLNDSEKKEKLTMNSLEKVWNAFPIDMDKYDLHVVDEDAGVAFDLISTLRTHDIVLTLNHTPMDTTMGNSMIFPDADETVMFKTIIENPSSPQMYEEDSLERENSHSELYETWAVKPNVLEMDGFDKAKSLSLIVRSFFRSPQHFQVTANFKHLFNFSPSEGEIPPHGSVLINIHYFKPSFLPSEPISVSVYIENEKITIPVKFGPQHRPPHFK